MQNTLDSLTFDPYSPLANTAIPTTSQVLKPIPVPQKAFTYNNAAYGGQTGGYSQLDKSGAITNVKVMKGVGAGCDEEALRVIKMAPKWKAGKQRGKAVSVSYNLPINFKLQ